MSLHLALGCTLIPSPASSIRSHNSSPTASSHEMNALTVAQRYEQRKRIAICSYHSLTMNKMDVCGMDEEGKLEILHVDLF